MTDLKEKSHTLQRQVNFDTKYYLHCNWNARQSAAFVSDPVTPPFDAGVGHGALSHRSLPFYGRSAMLPFSFMAGLALLLHLITALELTPMRSAS